MQEKVKFLGSIISKDGIAPDPEKVRAITEWPVPTDLKQVRGFVALASYYQKHIEHFADIARLLQRLSCKETPFIWRPCSLDFVIENPSTSRTTSSLVGLDCRVSLQDTAPRWSAA